ncbi:tryptophan-rich sensory protein [Candidatus Woesearchaeota archaeon]|nr:tryptophan-rich sensory protein [Candidatus Woesearchaeota archaeon]
MKQMTKFLLSMILPFIAASIGSYFTTASVSTWYAALQKPSFSPPNWIFTPVWIILYLMMGLALYLVWKEGWETKLVKTGMILFFIQLVLNALWSIVFFGFHTPFYGLICIIALWVAIAATTYMFYRVSEKATYLMIPYLLWVTFAAILNYYIYILNI